MTPDEPVPSPKIRAVPRGVRDGILYMRQALERRITGDELVRVTGVSERSLRRQFIAFLGQAPLTHFRAMRMASVRAALLSPLDDAASVTETAARFGFGHFGRFSAEYRRRFGELPSTTLSRGRTGAAVASAGRRMNDFGEAQASASALQHLCGPAGARVAPSLVIMPFRTGIGRLEERLLAEDLGEHIATALARAHDFSVHVARSGSAASATGASYCLLGQVAGLPEGRIRVILRLLDLRRDGRHLWGDAFEGTSTDLLGIRDRVMRAAATAIRPGLEAAEIEAARRKQVQSLDASDLVLRAMPLVLAADAFSARRALDLLEEAMALDPDDARPVALAAWCRVQLVLYHTTSDPAAARLAASRLAERATALDPLGDPAVLTARSCVAMWTGEPDLADALLARALAIDPGYGWAWERSATVKVCYGKPDRAIAEYRRAIALKGPRAPAANCWAGIGYAHLGAGRYAVAAHWLTKALAENPSASWLHFELVPCFLALDEEQAARASVDRLRRAHPEMTVQRAAATLPCPLRLIWEPRLERFVALGLPA